MFGWCLLFMLVITVLGRWYWKMYALKLSDVNARLFQVEELLLEVCSLIEEGSGKETLLPVEETTEFLAVEEISPTVEAPAEAEIELQEAELPKADTAPPTQSKSGTRDPKGKKGGKVDQQKLSEWNQQIIELYEKGHSVQEIARQIEKGQGEVQLVVDLYLQ